MDNDFTMAAVAAAQLAVSLLCHLPPPSMREVTSSSGELRQGEAQAKVAKGRTKVTAVAGQMCGAAEGQLQIELPANLAEATRDQCEQAISQALSALCPREQNPLPSLVIFIREGS
ncbi:MAG: hypothetical protein ABFR97_03115 [Thermodesulfobacteriota bacterium]